MKMRSEREWWKITSCPKIFDSFVLGLNEKRKWNVYSKDGIVLSERAWKEVKVICDYLYLIDDNDRYSLGWLKDNQLIIIAENLKYIDWITDDIFELTNEQHQKAIYKEGKCVIGYGTYKDFLYEIDFNPATGKNEVEIVGIDVPNVLLGKEIVQQSEKGYVVKDGDDYAFYDTNGELVLDFEYQDMKLFDDHVEATKKIFFD